MMDERLTKKIVEEVFEKAKKKSASHTRYALSREIESESRLSYRTLERAYNKYISKTIDEEYTPNADTVDQLCVYLKYQDYGDYVVKNTIKEATVKEDRGEKKEKETSLKNEPSVAKARNNTIHTEEKKAKLKNKLQFMSISGLFVVCMAIAAYINFSSTDSDNTIFDSCMTWNGDAYEEISCSAGSYSEYGTAVEPYDQKRFENFRRIDVDITTSFFSEHTQKPLLWYYKNDHGEIEYYTAAGLHPINGKTLKAVTEYIVQKYVPLHQNKESSFLIK